jgi:hypothetical protein
MVSSDTYAGVLIVLEVKDLLLYTVRIFLYDVRM